LVSTGLGGGGLGAGANTGWGGKVSFDVALPVATPSVVAGTGLPGADPVGARRSRSS